MTKFTDDLIVCMNIFWPKRLYMYILVLTIIFKDLLCNSWASQSQIIPFKGGMKVYWNNWGYIIIIPGWLPLQYLVKTFMTSSPKPSPIILKLGMHHFPLWLSSTKFICMIMLGWPRLIFFTARSNFVTCVWITCSKWPNWQKINVYEKMTLVGLTCNFA